MTSILNQYSYLLYKLILMSISSSKTEKLAKKFRVVFLGDLSVGKSSIIERFTLNKFDDASTIGIDFTLKDIYKNGQVYRMQMWDTAGSQRYKSLIPTYLKNASCVILVFDITRPETLDGLKAWHKMFIDNQDAPGIVVGNKMDLSTVRKITKQEAEAVAKTFNMKYFQVSAKTGKKIDEMFLGSLSSILEDQAIKSKQQTLAKQDLIQNSSAIIQSSNNNVTVIGKQSTGLNKKQWKQKVKCCN